MDISRESTCCLKLGLFKPRCTSVAFYALDDPPEAAVFSVLLELVKEMGKADYENESGELSISNVKVNA